MNIFVFAIIFSWSSYPGVRTPPRVEKSQKSWLKVGPMTISSFCVRPRQLGLYRNRSRPSRTNFEPWLFWLLHSWWCPSVRQNWHKVMAQSWSCWVKTCFGGHPSGWVGHHQEWKSQKSHGSKLVLLGRDLFRRAPNWLGGHHQEWKSQKSHGSKLVLLGRDLFRWTPIWLGGHHQEWKVRKVMAWIASQFLPLLS